MNNPTVSIVISSHNHEKYISQTIESILNQTFQDFEIIITDDGSSDKTIDKIKEFSDPRIKLHVFKQNEGACKALNNSINNSKGKCIVYISPEDVWELDKLERQVKFLDENSEIADGFRYSDFLKISVKEDIFISELLREKEIIGDHHKNQLQTIKDENQEKQIEINTQKNQLILKNEIIRKKDLLIVSMKKQEKEIESQIEELKTVFYEMEYLSNNHRSITQRLISKFPSLYIILKNKGLKNSIITIKGYRSIKNNHLFDVGFYLKKYGDIRQSGVDPILNYIFHGYKEGRKPNCTFDAEYYLNKYEDVQNSGLNPLIHYSLYGIKEKRKTSRDLNIKQKSDSKKDQQTFEMPPDYWKKKHEEILEKNTSLINLYPFKEDSPMVSIVILNRNGLNHLKRLFKNFHENIQYPSYEIIVADNASTDESVQFLETLREKLPLKIIKNTDNNTFSRTNNEAVAVAKGEYILLLNNDIEPAYGWLNEMMQITLKYQNVGAIGAKLVHPDCSMSKKNRNNSYLIQHTGIAFKKSSDGSIKPYNIGKGLEPFDSNSNSEEIRAGVTGAVLLVEKKLYQDVGGLDEEYNYGYEDVDFCLKLLKKGYDNIYCPKALLYHYEHGTDEANDQTYRLERFKSNENLLASKWDDWLNENFFIDK